MILLEGVAGREDVGRLADKIVTVLASPFELMQSDNVCIGVSIGISLYPQHGISLEKLMEHADKALYQAKEKGRGCYAYFSDELTKEQEFNNTQV